MINLAQVKGIYNKGPGFNSTTNFDEIGLYIPDASANASAMEKIRAFLKSDETYLRLDLK